jgi:hypothetical protein
MTDKLALTKSIEVLTDRAEDCSALAKAQRKTADSQHETASKLEKLSHALEVGAADLKKDLKAAKD